MGTVLNQLIGQFETMEKKALAKIAEDPMGNENSAELTGVPGAEHDVNVPADAKKPDPEVAQGQPADAASTEGAVSGGDAKPLEEGKMTVEEPALNPEQKPMVTDEAYAKEASEKVASLVNDLLSSISAPAEKKAEAKKPAEKPAEKSAKAKKPEIVLDDATISKLAAAISVYKKGHEAAEKVAAAGAAADEAKGKEDALRAIHNVCVKLAQDQGLSPEEAEAAANAVTADAAGPTADAAADAATADAAAAAAPEAASGAEAALPEDVTPEELGEAIVELVQEGQLDVDTAKAIVDELAGAGAGGEDISDDQAAQIVAEGLESGEITPEQAEAIAAELDGGAGGADEAAAEAAGAADADAAMAEAADEAQGAADADVALKTAAAYKEKTDKIAKSPFLSKVAEKLNTIHAEKKASASDVASDKYAEGFRKRAEARGVNPQLLAKYALNNMGNK